MYHGSLALKARRTSPVATTINCEPAAANPFKSELAREFRAKDDEEKIMGYIVWHLNGVCRTGEASGSVSDAGLLLLETFFPLRVEIL